MPLRLFSKPLRTRQTIRRQIADLNYRVMKPNDPGNIQKISEGNAASYRLTDADTFLNGTLDIIVGEEMQTFDYAELVLGTSISMENLEVVDVYTTRNEESASNGAMTLTCKKDGLTISIRTSVLYDENNNLVTEDAYMGKTIDVKGIVDYYDGNYQIKVLLNNGITIDP